MLTFITVDLDSLKSLVYLHLINCVPIFRDVLSNYEIIVSETSKLLEDDELALSSWNSYFW